MQGHVVPTETVCCFPNIKPCVTRDKKVSLNEKKGAFKNGEGEEMERNQRQLKERVQQGKGSYLTKLEHKLLHKNSNPPTVLSILKGPTHSPDLTNDQLPSSGHSVAQTPTLSDFAMLNRTGPVPKASNTAEHTEQICSRTRPSFPKHFRKIKRLGQCLAVLIENHHIQARQWILMVSSRGYSMLVASSCAEYSSTSST